MIRRKQILPLFTSTVTSEDPSSSLLERDVMTASLVAADTWLANNSWRPSADVVSGVSVNKDVAISPETVIVTPITTLPSLEREGE